MRNEWRRFQQGNMMKYILNDTSAPLLPIYFLMLLINTILRDTKDTLLVTLSHTGVEAIPFIKTYLVIPSSMLFFLFYSRLMKNYNSDIVFRIILSLFCGFYITFALILFPQIAPNLNVFSTTSNELATESGQNRLNYLLKEWPLAAFFIVSELWASGVCQLLFWQTANDALTVKQAKAIYPAIGAMGNLGMVIAGQVLLLFANERDFLVSARAFLQIPHKIDNLKLSATQIDSLDVQNPLIEGWKETLRFIAAIMLCCCLIIIVLFNVVEKRKAQNENNNEEDVENQAFLSPSNKSQSLDIGFDSQKSSRVRKNSKQVKSKVTLRQSLHTLSKNKAIRACAVLVVSYGVCSCLVEVTWKAEVKRIFHEPNEYSRFMAKFWFCTGIVSMFFMLFGRYLLPLEKYGYYIAVLFTPTAELIAGSMFYTASILNIGNSAYAGGLLIMITKSAKYAFFDTTKEMIFMSLNEEAKSIGKAAIELVCYRVAKSGGSIYLQLVIFLTGRVNSKAGLGLTALLFISLCLNWFNIARTAEQYVAKEKVTVF